jgi:PleD family two-component response regulator
MSTSTTATQDYYPYTILHKTTSFYCYSESSSSSPPHPHLQNQESNTITVERRGKDPFVKRILVVDDEPDVTLTFGVGLEGYYYHDNDKRRFEVYSYNNPLVAVREFKLNFYDLLLTDIYMPDINGFELCQKMLELDVNIRVCFMLQ